MERPKGPFSTEGKRGGFQVARLVKNGISLRRSLIVGFPRGKMALIEPHNLKRKEKPRNSKNPILYPQIRGNPKKRHR